MPIAYGPPAPRPRLADHHLQEMLRSGLNRREPALVLAGRTLTPLFTAIFGQFWWSPPVQYMDAAEKLCRLISNGEDAPSLAGRKNGRTIFGER